MSILRLYNRSFLKMQFFGGGGGGLLEKKRQTSTYKFADGYVRAFELWNLSTADLFFTSRAKYFEKINEEVQWMDYSRFNVRFNDLMNGLFKI